MIDTIRLAIPLSERQHTKLLRVALASTKPQWVLLHPQTGEIHFTRVTGLAALSQNSFHRELRWDITEAYIEGQTFLIIELSLPKYFYGHNITLLYDFVMVLRLLKQEIEQQLHCRFVDVMDWQVWRVDPCYAWDFDEYEVAKLVLDSLTHLHYPRKKREFRTTSIAWIGRSYSLKFYLKYPEFRSHDLQALIKAGVPMDWVNDWEDRAKGVLRFEMTCRKQYLRRLGIKTVRDLAQPNIKFQLRGNWSDDPSHRLVGIELALRQASRDGSRMPLELVEDGRAFREPPGEWLVLEEADDLKILPLSDLDEEMTAMLPAFMEHGESGEEMQEDEPDIFIYRSDPERSVTVCKSENPTIILQKCLTKLLGEYKGMQDVQKAKELLEAKYKQVKAARLLGFWLFVQRLGSEEAKTAYGHDSYYASKRDLKAAGVSLMEPLKLVVDNVKLEVPSEKVVNVVDNGRDSENVLNIQYRRIRQMKRANQNGLHH